MPLSRPLLTVLLIALVARPGRAQRVAPVALRVADAGPASVAGAAAPFSIAARDTGSEAMHEISAPRTVVGGVLGGAVGTAAGFALGSMASAGCQGEDCGLVDALLGALIGESVGLAVGAHVGSGSPRHDRLLLTSLASTGVLAGGVLAGLGLGRFDGRVGGAMIPITLVLQLVTTAAIEKL